MRDNAPRIRGLYAIADSACLNDIRLVPAVREAIAGGARVVQYRDKRHDARARLAQANELASLCTETGVTFIVNDDVQLAANCGADGVHLGAEDATVATARKRLGAGAIIGVSCYNDFSRAQAAAGAGADYVAFGSFYPSRTKPAAVRANTDLLQHARRDLTLAVVAIGGITPENGAALVHAGAHALAVIDGLFGARDVRATAECFAALFQQQAVLS